MPWTLGLLLTAVIVSWVLGNLFGVLSSYYPKHKTIFAIDMLSQAVRPIPYYVVALVLLVVFSYFIPIFPFSGAYPVGTRPDLSLSLRRRISGTRRCHFSRWSSLGLAVGFSA